LKPKPTGGRWVDYAGNNVYRDDESRSKLEFVAAAVRRHQPGQLWDLGCNSGDAALAALDAGAGLVVGFDSDADVLNAAYDRAWQGQRNFLPLLMDMTNPSPDSGWGQRERAGLAARRSADMVTALAFLHHLVIGRNVPLAQAVDWLLDLAPAGVLEFVPLEDPMIEGMLGWRDRAQFAAYRIDEVLRLLSERADIIETATLPLCGRHLIQYHQRS
jgi:ribosomal protein L11 methylase PrmA